MSGIIKQLLGTQYEGEKKHSFTLNSFTAPITTITLDKSVKGGNFPGQGQSDAHNYTLIGIYIVEAGRNYMVGLRPHLKGGIFYVEFKDSDDAIIQGQALIKLCNPARTKVHPVTTCNTRTLDSTDYLNRSTQPLVIPGLNAPTIWVTKDSRIELWFRPEVDLSVIDGQKENIVLLEATTRWL